MFELPLKTISLQNYSQVRLLVSVNPKIPASRSFAPSTQRSDPSLGGHLDPSNLIAPAVAKQHGESTIEYQLQPFERTPNREGL